MSDFHRESRQMACLDLCRITNESNGTENCYESLNRELRWLWNSVYNRINAHVQNRYTSNCLSDMCHCIVILTKQQNNYMEGTESFYNTVYSKNQENEETSPKG